MHTCLDLQPLLGGEVLMTWAPLACLYVGLWTCWGVLYVGLVW